MTSVERNMKSPRARRMSDQAVWTPLLRKPVRQVVDGLIAQMRSEGEGVLPIVLALRPELLAAGVSENDPSFDRFGRQQSAAESRFFKRVEPSLRKAITAVLSVAVSTTRATQEERS
jgi:hypothetical protein